MNIQRGNLSATCEENKFKFENQKVMSNKTFHSSNYAMYFLTTCSPSQSRNTIPLKKRANSTVWYLFCDSALI
jgi:hypothetical protein